MLETRSGRYLSGRIDKKFSGAMVKYLFFKCAVVYDKWGRELKCIFSTYIFLINEM